MAPRAAVPCRRHASTRRRNARVRQWNELGSSSRGKRAREWAQMNPRHGFAPGKGKKSIRSNSVITSLSLQRGLAPRLPCSRRGRPTGARSGPLHQPGVADQGGQCGPAMSQDLCGGVGLEGGGRQTEGSACGASWSHSRPTAGCGPLTPRPTVGGRPRHGCASRARKQRPDSTAAVDAGGCCPGYWTCLKESLCFLGEAFPIPNSGEYYSCKAEGTGIKSRFCHCPPREIAVLCQKLRRC